MAKSIEVAILESTKDGTLYGESDYADSREQEIVDELSCAVKAVVEIKTEGREKESFDALMKLDAALEGDTSIKTLLDKIIVAAWSASQEAPVKRQYGQWTLEADENGYRIYNPRNDGTKIFYLVKDGPYQNPVIEAEPDLAIDIPQTAKYVDFNGEDLPEIPKERIAGIICKDGNEVIHRFSFSNPKKPDFTLEDNNASIVIDGEKWHLGTLFSKDKNRIEGFDAYYKKEPQPAIRVIELADLDL